MTAPSMDMDTVINGLAHEMWATAQGRGPIEDVVTQMMAQLEVFAASVRDAERERCAMDVWMTLQEATADDADDHGLDGWMREAERRIKAGPNAEVSGADRRPLADVRALFGTWPGEMDDGFEEAIDELRHSHIGSGGLS